jgi:uncharacterized protein (DUF1697 family)
MRCDEGNCRIATTRSRTSAPRASRNHRTYVAFLRAVNVGGRNAVPMAALRRLLETLGYTDVRTYLRSGNAVFGAAAGEAAVAEALAASVSAELGVTVGVSVRSADELAGTVDANPFPSAAQEPKSLHVVFLPAPPAASRWARLDASRYAPEELATVGRDVYLHLPDGIGRSKLASAVGRAFPDGTARNWQTVTALAAMTAG